MAGISESVKDEAIEKLNELKTMIQKEGGSPIDFLREFGLGEQGAFEAGRESPRNEKLPLIIATLKRKAQRE